MIAGGLEDGAQIQRGHRQALQIVQLGANALQTAAEIVVIKNLTLFVGAMHHGLVPTLMHHAIAHHAGGIRDTQTAETIWENLVSHAVAKPLGSGGIAVIDRQLPAEHSMLLAVAVLAQPDALTVGAGEAEAIPYKFRLFGSGKGAGEQAFAGGGQVNFLRRESKLVPDQQCAGSKTLFGQGPQRKEDFRAAGDSTKGGFVAGVARVEYIALRHRGNSLLVCYWIRVFSPRMATPISSLEK